MRSDGSGLRRGTLSAGTDLPACWAAGAVRRGNEAVRSGFQEGGGRKRAARRDRKSTRLNSSHGYISYAVFCLKKKKTDVESGIRLAPSPFPNTTACDGTPHS